MKNYIFDVVGLGLNSVDVLCELNTFPAFNSKSEASNIAYQGGGQVATAMVALLMPATSPAEHSINVALKPC